MNQINAIKVVIVIVRWYIKDGMDDAFKSLWIKDMDPNPKDGLFREFFSKPIESINEKYYTLDMEGKHYTTYINVGIWRALEDFDKAIGVFIPDREKHDSKPNKEIVEVFNFEFKLRERIVMNVHLDRTGDFILPDPSILNKM